MYNNLRISDNSFRDIKTLYKLCFGLNPTISYLEKKYDTNLFGLKNVGIIAMDDQNLPAAYYGVFPITISYEKSDYLAAQSGDTMTAPAHRKKGLFETLAKEVYTLSEQLGVKMVFGFPNENSYHGFKKKLNWYFTGYMQKFSITVITIPFCELAGKYKVLKPMYQYFARNKLKRFCLDITNENITKFDFSTVKGLIKRDIKFFQYKINSECTSFLKMNGFKLLIKHDSHLLIGDVSYFEKSLTKDFIDTIKKISKMLGCRKVILTLSENHWLFEYLKDELTPVPSLPIGFYLIDPIITPEEIQFTGADYDTF